MTLDRYVLRHFFPIFLLSLSMFASLLLLIDLFANLWRYLAYEAAAKDIAAVMLLYLPKALSYSLPISALFAVAYTLGDLYARNELTVVCTSGIPLWRFAASLLILGAALSLLSFFFEDRIVIPTYSKKMEKGRALLHQKRSGNNSDIVVKAEQGSMVYAVDFYNAQDRTLNGVTIVHRDGEGRFLRLVRARVGRWNGASWDLENAYSYAWQGGFLQGNPGDGGSAYTEDPDTFRRNALDAAELSAGQARLFVQDLKEAGLPYAGALADYYRRFAFSATPLVVVLLSIAMGGWFKKNILLMCLLSSLLASVAYYVIQMLTMLLSKLGYMRPLAGAWAPTVLFLVLGAIMVRSART